MNASINRFVLLFSVFSCLAVHSHAQVQEWVIHYNGPGNAEDVGTDVAVDADGNAYVTGRSDGGATGLDYVTIKYDLDGNQVWIQRYDGGASGDDAASTIILDDAGNVYVTGYSEGVGTGSDFATIKYNSDGAQLWVSRYNGLNSNFPDEALAIILDDAGNVYVTGRSGSGGYFEWDYGTVKYNASGVQQWAARYNGPAGDWDQSNSVAVDVDGNVYVTGTFEFGFGGTAYHDYATIKYDASGITQWIQTFDGTGENWDEGIAVGLDDNGGVYVTGFTSGLGTVYDIVTLKYNTAGELLWKRLYNTNGTPSADIPRAMIVTGNGDVYISGATSLNFGTIKYNSAGDLQWSATYNNGNFDAAFGMDIDDAGNVIVAGLSSSGALESRYDYATILYNGLGQEQWVEKYNGSSNNRDEALAVAVDDAGNIYVTGYTTTGSVSDITTIRYSTQTAIQCSEISEFLARCNSSGSVLARVTLPNNTGHAGETVSFQIDDDNYNATIQTNGVHSRAQISVSGLGAGMHVVELVDPGSCFDPLSVSCEVDAAENESEWIKSDLLWSGSNTASQEKSTSPKAPLAAYPNPFNPSTTISYQTDVEGLVQLKVYDVLGREVAVLVDGLQQAGNHEIRFNGTQFSSGIYFLRLTAGSTTEMMRMILTK